MGAYELPMGLGACHRRLSAAHHSHMRFARFLTHSIRGVHSFWWCSPRVNR
jgi:hypothetical protein